jgi:hypothetical protein
MEMSEVEIKFSPEERDLIIEHTFAGPNLTKRLKKDTLYPDVDVQIVNSRIDSIGGQEHAIVVTARIS